MADPGLPVRGRGPRRGRGLPRRLHFKDFICQNERIWTLRGGVRRATVNVDPPLLTYVTQGTRLANAVGSDVLRSWCRDD